MYDNTVVDIIRYVDFKDQMAYIQLKYGWRTMFFFFKG